MHSDVNIIFDRAEGRFIRVATLSTKKLGYISSPLIEGQPNTTHLYYQHLTIHRPILSNSTPR